MAVYIYYLCGKCLISKSPSRSPDLLANRPRRLLCKNSDLKPTTDEMHSSTMRMGQSRINPEPALTLSRCLWMYSMFWGFVELLILSLRFTNDHSAYYTDGCRTCLGLWTNLMFPLQWPNSQWMAYFCSVPNGVFYAESNKRLLRSGGPWLGYEWL